MMKFIPGLIINQKFFHEIVKPLLKEYNPALNYSAGLIGYGSDVLGFDNPTSMDHNWGPRLQIFVEDKDIKKKESIIEFLKINLPGEFLGFPTNFSEKGLDGTQRMIHSDSKKINHLIEIFDIEDYFYKILNGDIIELTNIDWLCIPEQKLVEITSGCIFYDGLNKLSKYQSELQYYPQDVKLTKLAAYWHCISNEEAFIGRSVELNDFLGLKIINARIVNYLIKICFVLKETYIPYSKWFSRKFDELNLPEIKDLAITTLMENDPKKIEDSLANLYIEILRLQNRSANIPKIEKRITPYYNRPYKVIMADEIVNKIKNEIADHQLKNIDLTIVGLDNKIDSNVFTNNRYIEKMIKGT